MIQINLFKLLKRIEKHWLWPLLLLLGMSTLFWVFNLSKAGVDGKPGIDVLPALVLGLFNSLQFIVLNKDLNDVSGWLFGVLAFFQFALPLFASAAVLGGLFRDQLHPIWIRSAIKDLSGHHVIVGYGDFGLALNDELTKANKDVVRCPP